jgi:hypothetical protein
VSRDAQWTIKEGLPSIVVESLRHV